MMHTVPAASKGSARRHRVEGGRKHEVKIRFTDAEYDAIAARAADAKVSIQRFLVDGALARRSPRAVPSALIAELTGLHRLTANLASNINQIARRLNTGLSPDASLPAAADSVRRAMNRLDSALAWLDVPSQRNSTPDDRNAEPEQRKAVPRQRTANAAARTGSRQ
jgi:hypothetical protein